MKLSAKEKERLREWGYTTPESCGSCGADLGPSATYPWHYPDEDCRALKDPIPIPPHKERDHE